MKDQLSLFNLDLVSDDSDTKATLNRSKKPAKKRAEVKTKVEETSEIVIQEIVLRPEISIPGLKIIRDAFLTNRFQQMSWGEAEATVEEALFQGCKETLEHRLFLLEASGHLKIGDVATMLRNEQRRIDWNTIAVNRYLVFMDKIEISIGSGQVLFILRPGTITYSEQEIPVFGGDTFIGQDREIALTLTAPSFEVTLDV